MATRQLDSPNKLIRAIERWKRGAVALMIVVLAAGGSAVLVGGAIYIAMDLAGVAMSASSAIVLAGVTVSPWVFGNRQTLKTLASFATVADDES